MNGSALALGFTVPVKYSNIIVLHKYKLRDDVHFSVPMKCTLVLSGSYWDPGEFRAVFHCVGWRAASTSRSWLYVMLAPPPAPAASCALALGPSSALASSASRIGVSLGEPARVRGTSGRSRRKPSTKATSSSMSRRPLEEDRPAHKSDAVQVDGVTAQTVKTYPHIRKKRQFRTLQRAAQRTNQGNTITAKWQHVAEKAAADLVVCRRQAERERPGRSLRRPPRTGRSLQPQPCAASSCRPSRPPCRQASVPTAARPAARLPGTRRRRCQRLAWRQRREWQGRRCWQWRLDPKSSVLVGIAL